MLLDIEIPCNHLSNIILYIHLGIHFKKALFVPNISVYYKVGTRALAPTDPQVDLSWQFTLQRVWENLIQGERGT